MLRYGYAAAPWSYDGVLLHPGCCKAQFRRGIEIAFKPYPMPMLEEWQFPVTLNYETQQQLELQAKGTLILMCCKLTFLVDDGSSCEWNLTAIRKFGYTSNNFHFEAGRKSSTGEGMRTFLTDKGKCIHGRVLQIKEYYQFDLLCQRGVSPEQIMQQVLSSKKERDEGTLGRSRGFGKKTGEIHRSSQPELSKMFYTSQSDLTRHTRTSQPELMRSNCTSQPELMRSSCTSQPELMRSSCTSQPELMRSSCTSQPELMRSSCTSQPELMRSSCTSQPELMRSSCTSQPELMRSSCTSQPELVRSSLSSQPDLTENMYTS
nr:uncharacterized protein LOC128695016 [Cherax quadricarinatus]